MSSQLWVTRPVPAKISMHLASRPDRSRRARGAQDDLVGRASQALKPHVLKVRHAGSSARRPTRLSPVVVAELALQRWHFATTSPGVVGTLEADWSRIDPHPKQGVSSGGT